MYPFYLYITKKVISLVKEMGRMSPFKGRPYALNVVDEKCDKNFISEECLYAKLL